MMMWQQWVVQAGTMNGMPTTNVDIAMTNGGNDAAMAALPLLQMRVGLFFFVFTLFSFSLFECPVTTANTSSQGAM